MTIKHLLIHLQNSVDAFSLKQRHADRIEESLPDARITIAQGTSDFLDKLADVDCVLAWVFKAEWYERGPQLKAVFTPAAGRDWVETDPAGRVQTFYGSFHGTIMRESLLSMMLHFNRRMGASLADQQKKVWGRSGYGDCAALFSQNVLIIGFGPLGQSFARLIKAFGAHVTAVRRSVPETGNYPDVDKTVCFEDLEAELPHADHIVLALPGGAGTDGIIAAHHFRSIKPGAYLYNLGRGNCYREGDLVGALTTGPLAGAGLDVFAEEPLPHSSPLWLLPNVVITPHSSAISREYIDLFIEEWLKKMRELQTLNQERQEG